MKLLFGLLIIISIICVSAIDWRRAVKAVLFIVVIEGALRKWVLPQASELIYFLKDFVLLGAYIRYYSLFLLLSKIKIRNHFINVLVFCGAGWCVFQAFNPSLGSIIIGIWGVKNYLFYIPLIWLMPDLFESEEALYKFLRSHLLLIIPVGLIGFAQFASPASSFINSYAPGLESDVATFGFANTVRITGTFAYINNYGAYLVSCFCLLIPLLSKNQSWWWQIASIGEMFLVVVNTFMTGSRTPLVASGLCLIGYVVIMVITRPATTLRLIRWLFPSAVVISIAASVFFQQAISKFFQRAGSDREVSGRLMFGLLEPFYVLKYKGLDGYGPGATHPASTVLRRMLGLPWGEFVPVIAESETGKVVLELGLIGFLFWYGLRIGIIIALWLVFWKLKRPLLRQLALTAFLIHLIWLNGQMVFLQTFAVYYWFFSSFIFLLPRLEQIENWRQQQRLLQSHV